MTLPNRKHAVVDVTKLRGYALNPAHPEGRHKARVFQASLGITALDAEWLADAILAALPSAMTLKGEKDKYGQRFMADLLIQRGDKSVTVRSGWIIRSGEDFPRLVTCFIA